VNRWAVVIGQGPHTLAQSKVFRFSFAIIGGDNQNDILSNSDRAWDIYKTLPDQTPVHVAPASFGEIKAIFR